MKLEQHEGVGVLRLVGGKGNSMDPAFLAALQRLLDEAEAAEVSAVVLVGVDRFFSAGLALPALLGLDRAGLRGFMKVFDEVVLRLFTYPRPVVAAINGHAIAGGCVIAMQADVRMMAHGGGKIGLNEVHLGLGLPASVVETLRAQLAPPEATRVALDGHLLGPAEARELGLVHEVVPPEELEARAVTRARDLGNLPSDAYAQIKRSLRAPFLERALARADEDAERWLDTWFSPRGQDRLREAVRALKK